MAIAEETRLARALRITPNASQTRSKAPGVVGPRFQSESMTGFPLFAARGEGAYLWDDRGLKYLDCFGANAAIPLGYAYQPVVEAVSKAMRDGSLLSLPSVREAEVSEKFIACCAPWAHQVRWVKTGSEATHAALFLARAATGRRPYLRLRGSYHGWHHEWREAVIDAPDARWMDLHEQRPLWVDARLAAVIIEPPRWGSLDVSWLRRVVDESRAAGAVVIFDEMVYGLRWATGGSAAYYGVTPDLACFGKALGNGVPVACVCGPSHLMQHAVALVSGTYGGDLIGLAAAEAVLQTYLCRDVVGELWQKGRDLLDGFIEMAPAGQQLEGCAVHWRLKLPNEDVLDLTLAKAAESGLLVHRASNNASAAMTRDEARLAGRLLGVAVADALSEGSR